MFATRTRKKRICSCQPLTRLAFTRYCYCQYCTVYGIHKGEVEGVAYIAQKSCNTIAIVVGNAGGRGEYRDDLFVHKSLDVNEYLVKANVQKG